MAAPYAGTSLYVGDLLGDVNEGTLFEIFSAVGPVMSIRVCRDAVTNRSLGYAYVNFTSNADATRALEQLNGQPVHGRPCRVMWSQRDPSLRKSGVGNIFIKNLSPSVEQKLLLDTFGQYGNILSCKIAVDENNVPKGYGFVHFETQAAADAAIAQVNGMLLGGAKVFVGPFVPRKERVSTEPNPSETFTNVYVKNLPENFTNPELVQLFDACGKIISSVVMTKPDGQSRLFGFVNFETHESASKAVETVNGHKIGDKELFVGRAQKKHERAAELAKKYEQQRQERFAKYQAQQATNVYIRNLDASVTEEQLKAEFASAGNITSVKIVKDDKGVGRGYGFVSYSTAEEAAKAVNDYANKTIGGKQVTVAIAQRKDANRNQVGRMRPNTIPMYPYPYYGQPQPAYGYKAMPQQGWNQMQPQQPQGMIAPRGAYHTQQQPQRGGGGGGRGYARGFNNRRGGGRGGAQGGQHQGRHPQQRDQQLQQMPSQGVPAEGQQGDNFLAQIPPHQQKMVMGEQLFPLIEQQQPALAGKITGMILESAQIQDLIPLLSNQAALVAKIQEALDVLKDFETKQQQQQQATQPVDA